MSIINELTKEEMFATYALLLNMIRQKKERSDRESRMVKMINEALYQEIHRYVYLCVYKKCSKYTINNLDSSDYINAVWEEIFSNFYKYNGLNKLTTFINCYIEAGFRKQYEVTHGNFYYRKLREKYGENADFNVLENVETALSVSSPLPLDMNKCCLSSLSAEDDYIKSYCPDFVKVCSCLNGYEIRIILLYSGIIRGFYGRKYDIPMICTDVDLVKMFCDEEMQTLYGPFKRRVFDKVADKYIISEEPVRYIEPSKMRYMIKKILGKIKEPLVGCGP